MYAYDYANSGYHRTLNEMITKFEKTIEMSELNTSPKRYIVRDYYCLKYPSTDPGDQDIHEEDVV
jgi:hypothetical protein